MAYTIYSFDKLEVKQIYSILDIQRIWNIKIMDTYN